jgi:DNA polymerase-1
MGTATLVRTGPQFSALLNAVSASRRVTVDLETTGLDPLTDSILLMSLSTSDCATWVLPLFECPGAPRELIAALRDRICIAHNANFEYRFLCATFGWDLAPQTWWCTQVAEGLIQSGLRDTGEGDTRVSLAEVRQKYLGLGTDKDLQTSFVGADMLTFRPTEAQVQYAAQDVQRLDEVMEAQCRRLEAEGMLRVARLEMAVLPCVGDMELAGMKLNVAKHREVLARYAATEVEMRAKVEAELTDLYARRIARENEANRKSWYYYQVQLMKATDGRGRVTVKSDEATRATVTELRQMRDNFKPKSVDFNLGSHDQVWQALAEGGTELYKDTFEGPKPSLDKNVVKHESEKADANPVLKDYAAWAKAAKIVSTYGETLVSKLHPVTGRIHSSYNQLVSSGRFSSYNPNRQNMPPDIRECSEAEPGNVYVVADMVNQEGRIAACLSRDPNLLAVFRERKDWHSMTAALAYPEKFATWQDVDKETPGKGKEERAGCKNANFSSIYGGTAHTLYARGYVPSLAVGERLMNAVYTGYPMVREYALATADKATSAGYAVTVSGRRRYFRLSSRPTGKEAFKEWKRQQGGIRRAAMNHPVQGSGADVMKQAMVLLRVPMRAIGYSLVASVHDEVVYEGPAARSQEAQRLVEAKMLEAAGCFFSALPIPAESHVTVTWKK